MSDKPQIVTFFDVDNTLLDNDRVIADIGSYLDQHHGQAVRERYWQIYEEIRAELGYADYLGSLERLRLEHIHDPSLLRMGNWSLGYPFAERLYPGALAAVEHARQWGRVVILSDGDGVFQPWKIRRSGLWDVFGDDNVLIYIHKEHELDEVASRCPADHYVMVDDKLRILTAMKQEWGDRLTTVFPRQGHYALDETVNVKLPRADITVPNIADFINLPRPAK